MNILITGGSGFLAGRLAYFLMGKKKYKITLSTRRENYQFFKNDKVRILKIDWDSDSSIDQMCKDIDIIFHLASPNAKECEKDPEKAFKVNVNNTNKLVRIASKNRIKRIIYFSTAHVYSSDLSGNILESSITTNLHPYAKTHLMAEKHILNFNKKKKQDGIIFRLSNSFGYPLNCDVDCWNLFVNNLCKSGIEKRQLVIKSSKNITRNFLPIDELCRISNYFIDLKISSFKNNIFNIGGEKSYTLLSLAEIIKKEFKKTLSFAPKIICERSFDSSNKIKFNYSVDKLIRTGYVFESNNNLEIKKLIKFCNTNFGIQK